MHFLDAVDKLVIVGMAIERQTSEAAILAGKYSKEGKMDAALCAAALAVAIEGREESLLADLCVDYLIGPPQPYLFLPPNAYGEGGFACAS
jgi:hypothetical protein